MIGVNLWEKLYDFQLDNHVDAVILPQIQLCDYKGKRTKCLLFICRLKRAKTSGEPVYLYSVQDDSPGKRSCGLLG